MDGVIVTSDDIGKQFCSEFPDPEDRIEKPLVAHGTITSERLVLDGNPSSRTQQISVSRDVTTDDWIINIKYKESDSLFGAGRTQKIWAWVIQRDTSESFHLKYSGSGQDNPAELLREGYSRVLARIDRIENPEEYDTTTSLWTDIKNALSI